MGTTRNMFLSLAEQQMEGFHSNNLGWTSGLINLTVPKKIMSLAYDSLVRQKKAKPFDAMSPYELQIVWNTLSDFDLINLSDLDKQNVAKSLLVVEYFLNL